MRVFAASDVHVDYEENRQWIRDLSEYDYLQDVLILAGDLSHSIKLVDWCLAHLVRRFATVCCVPGNHDVWVHRDAEPWTSLEKLDHLRGRIEQSGATHQPIARGDVSIVPLLGWYDYSFGQPSERLLETWADFRACQWPPDLSVPAVAELLTRENAGHLDVVNDTVISFSHFLPRIDVMPDHVPAEGRRLYPVLGSARLEEQIRRLQPRVHVYGHSHVRRHVDLDGIVYINNAIGYPHEPHLGTKVLACVHGEGSMPPVTSTSNGGARASRGGEREPCEGDRR